MQLGAFKSAIVAGHSLFFRRLMLRYGEGGGTGGEGSEDSLAARLGKQKMNNCACVAVDIQFQAPFTATLAANGPLLPSGSSSATVSASVVSAEMLFGTGLVDDK